MIGSVNCVYETPCGWCSKWDKRCDKRMPPERGQRAKARIYDDYAGPLIEINGTVEDGKPCLDTLDIRYDSKEE